MLLPPTKGMSLHCPALHCPEMTYSDLNSTVQFTALSLGVSLQGPSLSEFALTTSIHSYPAHMATNAQLLYLVKQTHTKNISLGIHVICGELIGILGFGGLDPAAQTSYSRPIYIKDGLFFQWPFQVALIYIIHIRGGLCI